MDIAKYIITMVVLVLLSAYFSATETAFSSLNKTRLKTMAEKGEKRAETAYELSESYDRLISTILVGNNIVNIALASIGTVMFVHLCGDAGATISTAVITVAVLIFGEISPKSIAKDAPERFAMFSAPIIRALIWLLTPINFIFTQWQAMLAKIFKVKEDLKMSQEELLMLVDEIQQDGSVDTEEGELIRNAIEFTEQEAEDILTHRVDVEAVPITADKDEIARTFAKTQFSRLLVYKDSIDNIVGVIHLKDFFTGDGVTKKAIKHIMTKPLFIQKSVRLSDLLKILQKNKSHLAVVLDEYGGTLGIVTMEDILEELVGEIWDEHDEVVEDFKKEDDNTYRVDGLMDFDDFCDFFGIECEAESTSVGGWVTEQLGKIPEDGDRFVFDDLSIIITKTEAHRVAQILVVLKDDSENAHEDEDENKNENEN